MSVLRKYSFWQGLSDFFTRSHTRCNFQVHIRSGDSQDELLQPVQVHRAVAEAEDPEDGGPEGVRSTAAARLIKRGVRSDVCGEQRRSSHRLAYEFVQDSLCRLRLAFRNVADGNNFEKGGTS